MIVNKHIVFGVLFLPGLAISHAHADVPKGDAVEFIRQYQQALISRDADTLNYLIAEDARIRIELDQGEGGRQQYTLTAQRFLQQIRALWHFSGNQKLAFSVPEYSRNIDGAMMVTVQQEDHRELFGQQTGQQDRLTIKLDQQSGRVRITELHSVSRLW
jgi:hypothetical protein